MLVQKGMIHERSTSLVEDGEVQSERKNGEALVKERENEKTQRPTQAPLCTAIPFLPEQGKTVCNACCKSQMEDKKNCKTCVSEYCGKGEACQACCNGQKGDCEKCKTYLE